MNVKKRKEEIISNRKVKNDYIKVKHPDFGYVEFRGMTPRQLDILKHYKSIVE